MNKNPFEAIQLIRTRRPWLGLTIALLVFLIAVGIRYAFNEKLYNVPFITIFPAILISALVGGLRVGLLVAVLSAVAAWLLFLPPSATTALHWPDGYLTWALFALTCFIQLASFICSIKLSMHLPSLVIVRQLCFRSCSTE